MGKIKETEDHMPVQTTQVMMEKNNKPDCATQHFLLINVGVIGAFSATYWPGEHQQSNA